MPYDQLGQLLGWDASHFEFMLKEDDGLWIKFGKLKPKCVRVTYREPDAAAKSAELSKIFDWYKDDFKAEGGAIAFINKRRSIQVPADAKISYQDYDWGLNEAK